MGVVFTSCWHPRAKLSFGDKVVNTITGYMLPLSSVGKEGVDYAENVKRINALRDNSRSMVQSQYQKQVEKGGWKVTSTELTDNQGKLVPVLIHAPASGGADLPLIIWTHGGACTLMDYKDSVGAELINGICEYNTPGLSSVFLGTQCVWVSVDYRLAPEHKFPAPVEDVVSVYRSLNNQTMATTYGYSTSNIGLAGISAGGFLAGHAATVLAKDSQKIAFVALLYPMSDPSMQTESHKLYGDLPMCPGKWLAWSWSALLTEDGSQPSEKRMREANLLLADWKPLKSIPTLLMTGMYDPLHDEGRALCDLMVDAGLQVESIDCPGSHCLYNFHAESKKAIYAWWRSVLAA